MITITETAAKQIQASAQQTESENMSLRIAARKNDSGKLEYAMGFDHRTEADKSVDCHGVNIIVSPDSQPLLDGATLDYVELNPGKFEFIFINPNDPEHKPPQ
jgi:iron-sulfur cluster assembly protein